MDGIRRISRVSHVIVVLLLCFYNATAQHLQETFTVKEGLSENVIYCLFQDKKGFLWVGTHEGLNRYDGYGFRKYMHKPGDSTSLPNTAITGLFAGKHDVLLLNTAEGTRQMDPATNAFRQASIPNRDLLSEVYRLSPSRTAALIYNFTFDPFWLTANLPSQNFPLTDLQKSMIQGKNWMALYFDRASRLWILEKDSLVVIDDKGSRTKIISDLKLDQDETKLVNRLIDDRNGLMWLRVNGKLVGIDKVNLSVRATLLQSQLPDLPFDNILALLLDRSGVLWVGSFYGLKKLNLNPEYFRHFTAETSNGLASNFTLGLNIYNKKLVVQHYFLDSFYSVVDLASRQARKQRLDKVSFEQYLREVLTQQPERVSELSWQKQMQNKELVQADRRMIRYVYADYEEKLWTFYFQNRLVNLTDTNKVLFDGSAEELYDDKEFLWIATTNEGLIRYNKKSYEVKRYRTRSTIHGSISSDQLLCIEPGMGNDLWIGTRAGGIIHFDKSSEKFKTYSKTDGLCNNTVYNMVMDNSGNVWMGTAQGLSCLDPRTGKFRNFYTADGLRNSEYNRWSAIKDEKGILYFGGMNGIDYFDPGEVLKASYTAPEVQITAFKTGNELLSMESEQSLHYRQNYISFEFASMDFRNPSATQYMYQLQGTGSDWIKAEGNHTAAFAALPPGKYTFVIKAAAKNGIWSEEKKFSFRIRAPWWQQSWFYALCAIGVITLLYTFYRVRIDQLKKVMAIRARISRDLHDDVGASLSSIHIYSSVARKALQNDQDKAHAALEKINESSRKVLEDMSDIVWALSPRDQDGKSFSGRIKNYGSDLLSQQQIDCKYSIDPQAEKKMVNPDARKNILLIVKEALNNIAKYSEATQAEVTIRMEGNQLILMITDNGKGILSDSTKTGNGMINMRQRTEMLGGSFQVNSEPGKGTRIICQIPVTNFSDKVIGKV